jgi:hypothetical protein
VAGVLVLLIGSGFHWLGCRLHQLVLDHLR